MPRALVAMLAVALALGLPTAAFAQGAGSDQYNDPLAGQRGGTGNTSGAGSGGNGGGNTTTPSADTTSTGDGTTAAQARDQLPATGADAWLIALAGAGLLFCGVGIRGFADARV